MTAITTQNVVDAGTVPTFAAAAATSNTAEVGNGHDTFLVVKNTNGATRTVTITVPGNTEYGQPAPDPVITVAATTGEAWIPLRKAYDAADGTGRATFVLEATAGVTLAVVRTG